MRAIAGLAIACFSSAASMSSELSEYLNVLDLSPSVARGMWNTQYTTGLPYRDNEYDSSSSTLRVQSRFLGLDDEWSPAWELDLRQTSVVGQWQSNELSYRSQEAQTLVGVNAPSGWLAMAGRSGWKVGYHRDSAQFITLGRIKRFRADSLSLFDLNDATTKEPQDVTFAWREWQLDYEWGRSGLRLAYSNDGNASIWTRHEDLTLWAELQSRAWPRSRFSSSEADVELADAEVAAQVIGIQYSGADLPYPLSAIGASQHQFMHSSVVYFDVEGQRARLRTEADAEANSFWVETQGRYVGSRLQLTWLQSNVEFTATSTNFPSFVEDFEPLPFTDALLLGVRLGARSTQQSAELHVWVQQWIPLATWGSGDAIDIPDDPDDDASSEPGEPGGSQPRNTQYGGFEMGVQIRL
ncbi:hypothetical protein NFC81_06415 [Salinispirillum sp. LH 10-3-1]|uniref:Uncharacterized protein n=1 Tax=Salinispirillum sp. LH 10-3-1 TaxID=2952525 RepID=A0AB38YJA4_9GAMM